MNNLGFLLALGAAIAWGSYAVPFRKSKTENLIQYQAVMTIGILLSGFIFSLIIGYPISFNIYGLLSGFLWAIANFISLSAFANLGISKAAPILSSLVIISTFLWGIFAFNELPTGIIMASVGILVIVVGVIIVSTINSTKSLNTKKGLVSAVLAGLIFGSQLVPLKIGKVEPSDFFFSSTMGIFIIGMIIFLLKRAQIEKKAVRMSLFSGIIWNVGNLLSIIAVSLIGIAKSIPLTQLALLVAVLWGVFYFKEVRSRKDILQVLIGAFVLLAGVVVLSLS